MHRFDVESAKDFRERFERHAAHAAPVVAIRHHVMGALLAMRLGAEQEALEYIDRANAACVGKSSMFSAMPMVAKMFCTLGFRGVAPAEQFIALGHESRPPVCRSRIQANLMIARGEFVDVEELLADKLSTSSDSSDPPHLDGGAL